MAVKNETGNKYGRLTVIERAESTSDGVATWKCICECGNTTVVSGCSLRSGHTRSCGCLQRDFAKNTFKDIAGQRFGRLTAIRPTSDRKGESVIWECKCDCGNVIYKSISGLQFQNVKSCGCLRKEISSQIHKKDLVGKRFGKLVVIEETSKRNKKKIIWKCLCDCGNICEASSDNLISGSTKSCGCLRKEKAVETHTDNLVGQKFGKLTVIKKTNKRRCGCVVWLCKCDCGNFYEAPSVHLKDGHIKSCGCLSSKGELKIQEILEQGEIPFKRQYSFPELKSKKNKLLKFDFAIFKDDNLMCLIEFHGRQHYEVVDYFGGEDQFKTQQENDALKEEFCKKNDIPLLIIPHTEYEQINIDYITNFLKKENVYVNQGENDKTA